MTGAEVRRVAVVGAGLAAAKAVETLRDEGFGGDVVVYGAERHLPYERPPLSKGYLMGDDELDAAFVHDAAWYDDKDIEVRVGDPVTSIDLGDPREVRVVTAGGDEGFDRALLATGSLPRRLATADASGAPVTYLRTIEDSQRVKAAVGEESRIVIVGGGWIGLEVASAARRAGAAVTIIESLDLPLLRVLGPEVARGFASLHSSHGVDLRTGCQIAGIEAVGASGRVRLDDETSVEADLIVVGVGVLPDTSVAAAAGLALENGVVCDDRLRTSDPRVYAAGDIANAYHPRLERHVRVEHWDNAIEQGQAAARNILGADSAYTRLPYFFSDQYDVGLEYVGSVGPDGYDEVVVRGSVADQAYTAFWLRDGRVLAGMHVNDWDAIEQIRRIVEAGGPVD